MPVASLRHTRPESLQSRRPGPRRRRRGMEGASPARLYATLVGGVLVVIGIVGFFYSSSFGSPGNVDDVFGILAVNAWHNLVHIVTGAIGLLVAGYAARQYALWLGAIYIAIAIWGFIIGGGESILGFVPVNTEDNFLHLILGLLGVGAAMATPIDPAT
ncbi:MAG: DUF4383 domain-containing protein [Solirubrobacterales bacterium]|nr:DUF4383 domain-containing protein [Solirubrobacterales bacterium]